MDQFEREAADRQAFEQFAIKDSGERLEFDSGMVRDVTEGKTNFALVADGPMFVRWAVHMTKGAVKYAARNWMKARGQAEYDRFRESAFRHFMQWYYGDTDEDHAAAVFFNINGAEYVRGQLPSAPRTSALIEFAEQYMLDPNHPALTDPDEVYGAPV